MLGIISFGMTRGFGLRSLFRTRLLRYDSGTEDEHGSGERLNLL